MDWLSILGQIFEVCIIPLLGILTSVLVQFIQLKKEEMKLKTQNELTHKYLDMLADTVSICVVATNQTYVNSLKEQGAFDLEAQKTAFNMTYNNVLSILSEEAKRYLNEAVGDLTLLITQQIEQRVNQERWYASVQ